tara:strand:+ start:241 stop:633 length:393 start_codon:yes stop_codon:yes gene_type:complete
MEWYLKVMRDNYANFSGRARRKEYWMFYLFYVIALIVLMVLDNVLGTAWTIDAGYGQSVSMGYGWLYMIGALAHMIPGLAVSIRRLHDIGKSGWWVLISLVPLIGGIWLLVLWCTEGEKSENKWGSDPKA